MTVECVEKPTLEKIENLERGIVRRRDEVVAGGVKRQAVYGSRVCC